MEIPKIIHQVWEGKTEPLPPLLTRLGETWKACHPTWEYCFWDKQKMDAFIQAHFSYLLPVYNAYLYDVQRWDVIRYLILYKIGGVYVDFDYECLEPVDRLLADQTCIFGLEAEEHALPINKPYVISNAFMCAIPGHPFVKQLIKKVSKIDSITTNKFLHVLETTGPYMIYEEYEKYLDKEQICLLPANIIAPLSKVEVTCFLNGKADEEQLNSKIQNAVAIHYYFGSWL